jgi:hypothetical protein
MAFAIASNICRKGRLSPFAAWISELISAAADTTTFDFVIIRSTVSCEGGSGEWMISSFRIYPNFSLLKWSTSKPATF